MRIQPGTGWGSYDTDEWNIEPIDFVGRLAKEDNVENVIKWALDENFKHAGQLSGQEVRKLIDQIKTVCFREISILRTIYEMENQKAECLDIVVKARDLLQEYDRMSIL